MIKDLGEPTLRNDYVALGVYLGYPICCIVAFATTQCSVFSPHYAHRLEAIPLYGTGFVPCMRCATQKTAAELIAEIQHSRLAPQPFPEADAGRISAAAHFLEALHSGVLIDRLNRSIDHFVRTESREAVTYAADLSDTLGSNTRAGI